ncbi:nuclear factor of activated T-cells, cytoplasmic 3 isoform X1 [Colossoma macropomum]|uniref:nuclear factor of activated T-cells, cytoplasmic 3 isoform X1 n=1 Tax=Colossoma macropomum TaxID=42526 RepID=UPI001864D0CB|nr:nuclear factor of activated T-cells, cytoplasmic 3 isoform X1 [Colossoma macropomum]
MTTANRGGEELDFRLMFGEDAQLTSLGHTDGRADNGAPCYLLSALQEELVVQQPPGVQGGPLPSSHVAPSSSYCAVDSPSRVFDCPSIQITSIPASCHQDTMGGLQDGVHHVEQQGASGPLASRDQLYLTLDPSYRDTAALCPSPCSSLSSRSWLSDASSCESFSHIYDDVEAELNEAAARVRLGSPLMSPLGSPLPSPLTSPQASPQVSPMVSPFGSPSCAYGEDSWFRYQQQQRLYTRSLSPHQSPYQSPRASVTEETWLSPRPHSSSSSRPSSRPTSPYGKRPYSSAEAVPGSSSPHLSPCPSPSHSPRGSVTDETWLGSPGAMAASFQACSSEIDIPTKTRRTYHNQESTSLLPGQGDPGLKDHSFISPSLDSNLEVSLPTLKKEDIVEHFLSVPPAFAWGKPKQTQTPLFRPTSLPPLDSPLPSQYGQCELKLEIQPKPHHRAHYETEGSRGAIKSACGRHPIVKLIGYSEKPVSLQMFIGTADDRHVRPHAFYQVHRITGKTVATPSQEMLIGSTKILEIPLLPENNMSASIDCAGILKLRNSDIELRKGETDIGRKNTRVRAVFRVHIPQASGTVLSLQVASIPIECSQRSAQELPQIEQFSPTSGSVTGGQEMLIKGPNITPESKVIFLEKGPDGKTQWEVDAKIVCEKSTDTSIVVKIPPYYKRILTASTQVQFYISNGKRKRSPAQQFHYVSAVQVKQECDVGDDVEDHVNPLEQWLYSGGPVCVPSSTQLSYSPMGSSYLDRHPPDGSLSTGPGFHSIFNPPSLDFSKPSYQGPQQNLSYNGQSSLPSDLASGGKLSPLMSEHAASFLGIGHHGSTGGVHPVNQVSAPRYNEGYLSPSSGSNQPDLSSPNHYISNPVDLDGLPKSSSSLESPVSHPPLASTVVPSTSPLNREALINLKSTKTPSPQAAGTSGPETSLGPGASQDHSLDGKMLNIKQEPAEEKELTFQSIGLQDITLDDVSEIIVRDWFQSPDPAGDAHSVP